MNKFKTLAIGVALMFGALSANAQTDKTFSFLDAAGNEVPDGSTVTFYVTEEAKVPGYPMFGLLIQAKFDLKVKNNTNSSQQVAIALDVEKIANGSVEFCFEGQCQSCKEPGKYQSPAKLVENTTSLSTEWMPEKEKAYGETDCTVQILKMNGNTVLGYGPKVKVHCIYADPTGIVDMESDNNAKVVSRYDVNGNKLSAPAKGLNIVRMSNGETRKIIVK